MMVGRFYVKLIPGNFKIAQILKQIPFQGACRQAVYAEFYTLRVNRLKHYFSAVHPL